MSLDWPPEYTPPVRFLEVTCLKRYSYSVIDFFVLRSPSPIYLPSHTAQLGPTRQSKTLCLRLVSSTTGSDYIFNFIKNQEIIKKGCWSLAHLYKNLNQ